MYSQIVTTAFLSSLTLISTSYLEAETNFLKPKLERNNVVNKGLWIRSKGPRNPNEFIFRANSLDVDKILQNNFDSIGTNVESSPIFNSYIDRNKRSANDKRNTPNSSKRCKNKDCSKLNTRKLSMIKSKLISTLKPASVFNDYPYEVAILLNNKKDEQNNLNSEKVTRNSDKTETTEIQLNKNITNLINEHIKDFNTSDSNFNSTYNNVTIPKRSMDRRNYETELIKKIEFTESLNNTYNKFERNVFDRNNMEWHEINTDPMPNVNTYKVLPKSKSTSDKIITERGLLKLLTMLTRTFKKIMKQHHDIKRIHKTITNLNDDFIKNIKALSSKYEDINLKYSQIMKIYEALLVMETKIKEKEVGFDKREKDLAKNLQQFQNQQKKFLDQQRQFYNIQKVMLAQNEKINMKQNLIAKTQSDISHRQNNFARIFKKAKQIYIDSKNFNPSRLNSAIVKTKMKPIIETDQPIKISTTVAPIEPQSRQDSLPTTEPVKINLFSIQPVNKIKNQDQKILEEKDEQSVDELIYKYYFNNTFIDELMKNKILATFVSATEDDDNNINKNKRNEDAKFKTTILLPVNKTEKKNKSRKKRWIKHSKKTKKEQVPKPPIRTNVNANVPKVATQENIDLTNMKDDPFITMASKFCKEIGQNGNLQVLKWCIEKALRRLKAIDLKASLITTPIVNKTENNVKSTTEIKFIDARITSTTPSSNVMSTQKTDDQIIQTTEGIKPAMFFPDNEELENKIKEYELVPDPEGTVYFDGSLHASDLGIIQKNSNIDSEGFSDIMPGLDSNSRVQVDPLAFDLQAQRRANVRRINERIMKMKLA